MVAVPSQVAALIIAVRLAGFGTGPGTVTQVLGRAIDQLPGTGEETRSEITADGLPQYGNMAH
jgi:hypothetical protein